MTNSTFPARPRRLVFFCDLSRTRGTGHFRRCLILARKFQTAGASVEFVKDRVDETLLPKDFFLEFQTMSLDDVAIVETDLIVIDSYDPPLDFLHHAKEAGAQLLQIDDICAQDYYPVDHLLINNLALNKRDYSGKTPADCVIYDRPEFFLLDDTFVETAKLSQKPQSPPKNVMLFFGGTDPFGLMPRVLNLLAGNRDIADNKTFFVVLAAQYPEKEKIRKIATGQQFEIIVDTPDMASLLSRTDAAIGCGGGAMWERICLGIPAIEIGHSDWQQETFARLHDQGLIHYAGHASDVSDALLWKEFKRLLDGNHSISSVHLGGGLSLLAETLLNLKS